MGQKKVFEVFLKSPLKATSQSPYVEGHTDRIINIDHQLQRTSDMRLVIESTKTNAGTRKLPMSEDVFRCFQAIIEDREAPRYERVVDGYTGVRGKVILQPQGKEFFT